MFKSFPGTLRKLVPTLFLIAVATLAGATDVFSAKVHELVGKLFFEYGQKLLPFSVNLLVGAIIINVAFVLYQPLREGLERALASQGSSERGKNLVLKTVQLLYWGGAILIALTIVAPDVLSKVFLGGSLLLAALTLALQGAANDFISGLMLQFGPKFKVGDEIDVIGMNVTGKVVDVGYVSTHIESADGRVVVPNREIWTKAVKVVKPQEPKSLIILPPGVVIKKKS